MPFAMYVWPHGSQPTALPVVCPFPLYVSEADALDAAKSVFDGGGYERVDLHEIDEKALPVRLVWSSTGL